MKIERTKLETTKGQGINDYEKHRYLYRKRHCFISFFNFFIILLCVCVGVCSAAPQGPHGV